jgi:hypothetical protein
VGEKKNQKKPKTPQKYLSSSASRTTNLASVASCHPIPSRCRGRCRPEGRDCAPRDAAQAGARGERRVVRTFFLYGQNLFGVGTPAFVRRKDRECGLVLRHFGLVLRHLGLVLRHLGLVLRHFGMVLRYFGLVLRHFRPGFASLKSLFSCRRH